MICFKCKKDLDWTKIYFNLIVNVIDFKKGGIKIIDKNICKDCLNLEVLL